MARTKKPPIPDHDRKVIGAMLRDLRRAAGYRSVEAAAGTAGCPASRQTIYLYERGEATPSLPQFLELVEFFVLEGKHSSARKAEADLRATGVAAVARALSLPAYHVVDAFELMERMQPDLTETR